MCWTLDQCDAMVQVLTHLRTRLAMLGVQPAEAPAAAASLPQMILDGSPPEHQHSIAASDSELLATAGGVHSQPAMAPDWKAALLVGGRKQHQGVSSGIAEDAAADAAAANVKWEARSSLCERLLAELLLRSLPDRECAGWPLQRALQARVSAGTCNLGAVLISTFDGQSLVCCRDSTGAACICGTDCRACLFRSGVRFPPSLRNSSRRRAARCC